jgi:Type I restriction enzyme R protein N terminus (HSDR_N)
MKILIEQPMEKGLPTSTESISLEKIIFKNNKNQAACQVMIPIAYPIPGFSMRQTDGKDWLFDPIRKKWVVITPEEWVRQNFIQYLIQTLHYPAACIAVEKGLQLGEMQKRIDVMVYKNHQPWMLIECKEPNIPLSEKTMQQVLAYQASIPCSYIILTNGNHTLGFEIKQQGMVQEIDAMPAFQ